MMQYRIDSRHRLSSYQLKSEQLEDRALLAVATVDDWTLDLNNIDGVVGTIDAGGGASGIDFMTFHAKTHSRLTDVDGSGGLSVGDIYAVNILGFATELFSDEIGVLFGSGINNDWQLSFDATLDVEVTAVAPNGLTFKHLAAGVGPSDGLLDFYVDGPNGGITNASSAGGQTSFTDGVKIATFSVLDMPSDGGGIFLGVGDGSDDSTYNLVSALPNVLLDSDGTDLSLGTLLGFVDSNVDIDPASAGTFSAIGVSSWPNASPTENVNESFEEFFADEDGSLRIAEEEPELGSIHGIKFLDETIAGVEGRMTGGGSVFTTDAEGNDDVRVTHGFELHCSPNISPNNLEVNWEGNRFHLESLSTATCTDDPTEDQLPRHAPIDTLVGTGLGRYNGVSGFKIEFKLTDFGEPGTKDIAEFTIQTPDGLTTILEVANNLDRGNHQAHPENKPTDGIAGTGNGVFDPGEIQLNGVKIILTGSDGSMQMTVTENGKDGKPGQYWFTDLIPNVTYTVTEVPPPGSTQTTPNPPPITILPGKEWVATEKQAEDLVIHEGIDPEDIIIEPLLAFGNAFEQAQTGRMTGGGSVFIEQGGPGRNDDIRVTHGFELHCNALIEPNNLEVNWEGNRFHLEELTGASCSDNPDEDQLPRQAPIDTFDGVGVGRYNGVSGFQIEFQLTDFGEPGTKDIADITIKTPDGLTTILAVSNQLDRGNHQAHPENKKAPNGIAKGAINNAAEDSLSGDVNGASVSPIVVDAADSETSDPAESNLTESTDSIVTEDDNGNVMKKPGTDVPIALSTRAFAYARARKAGNMSAGDDDPNDNSHHRNWRKYLNDVDAMFAIYG